MHTRRHLCSFVLCVAALGAAGCGLKGPLYLPDEKAEHVESSNPAKQRRRIPAPQSQKKDRDTQSLPPPTDNPQPSTPDVDRPAESATPPAADR
jgi:predicted small lipoprotein YifL